MDKNPLLKACRHLLNPIVRMLIRNGITWREFAELSKEVYVDTARRDYGLQGRPTNAARVALLTGLSRREVGRIKNAPQQTAAPTGPQDRISTILTNWHLDPDFCDKNGDPRLLTETGPTASIEQLFRRYAGDTPHGALLKELMQLELVAKDGNWYRVTARSYVRSQSDPNLIEQAGVTLHDHATTTTFNTNADRSESPRFDRMATALNFPTSRARQFHNLLETKGQAFLEELDQWLAKHSGDEASAAPDDTLRIGVGVYLIHDEAHGSTQHD